MIHALTLKQPWASLVAGGCKDVENRTWRTNYRGPLLIHAGRAYDRSCPSTWQALAESVEAHAKIPHGEIIGVVDLIDVIENSRSPWATRGQYHWLLGDAERLHIPIPVSGHLGLWTPDDEILDRVLDQITAPVHR